MLKIKMNIWQDNWMQQAKLIHTQFIGSAVFKDGVMIDKLNGQETRIVNIFDDTTEIKDISINDK